MVRNAIVLTSTVAPHRKMPSGVHAVHIHPDPTMCQTLLYRGCAQNNGKLGYKLGFYYTLGRALGTEDKKIKQDTIRLPPAGMWWRSYKGRPEYLWSQDEGDRADFLEKGTPESGTNGTEKSSRRGFGAKRQRQRYTNEHWVGVDSGRQAGKTEE